MTALYSVVPALFSVVPIGYIGGVTMALRVPNGDEPSIWYLCEKNL